MFDGTGVIAPVPSKISRSELRASLEKPAGWRLCGICPILELRYPEPETDRGNEPVAVIISRMDTILSGAPEQLRPFVSDGRITVMPVKRAPRLLLLDQVAQAFEPGRRYDEATVNGVLKTVTDDHATLRRYLVDEGLLSRTAGGTYWRSGGSTFLPAWEASPAPEAPPEPPGPPDSRFTDPKQPLVETIS